MLNSRQAAHVRTLNFMGAERHLNRPRLAARSGRLRFLNWSLQGNRSSSDDVHCGRAIFGVC